MPVAAATDVWGLQPVLTHDRDDISRFGLGREEGVEREVVKR